MEAPTTQFKPLHRADGSAVHTDRLFSVLASVNGPVEVQRRDELPEEAAIEVNIRPLSGVGGPRERWLEDVVHSLLQSILLVHLYPRTLIQVTLQITKEPEVTFTHARGDVSVLPALINAAFAGLVDAGLPLRTTAVAGLAAVSTDGRIVRTVEEKELQASKSVHAMVYDKDGTLLLDESAGVFDYAAWEKVSTVLQDACTGALRADAAEDVMRDNGEEEVIIPWLREALEEKARRTNAWREAT